MRGVPDMACRKTLVGEKAGGKIEKQLFNFGFRPRRVVVRSEFRFGNAGTLVSEESVLLPAKIAGKRIVIKTAILPNEGSETPLLLSKEFLRQLGCVMNFASDVIQFHEIGAETQIIETSTGHYGIRLFNFEKTFNIAADCCAAEHTSHVHTQRGTRDKAYDVSQLEIEVKKISVQAKIQDLALLVAAMATSCSGVKMTEEMTALMENVKHIGTTSKEVDDCEDHMEDNESNPVDPKTTMKVGKCKNKSEDLNAIYHIDKGDIRWVRTQVNTENHVEMQRLKLYVLFVGYIQDSRTVFARSKQSHRKIDRKQNLANTLPHDPPEVEQHACDEPASLPHDPPEVYHHASFERASLPNAPPRS
jgi:glutathione peroxidase-family protein